MPQSRDHLHTLGPKVPRPSSYPKLESYGHAILNLTDGSWRVLGGIIYIYLEPSDTVVLGVLRLSRHTSSGRTGACGAVKMRPARFDWMEACLYSMGLSSCEHYAKV